MMESKNIYQDIAQRTQGNIYLGVVGPVRTGKSTFIKRFMETLVLPNIENTPAKERAIDELPQSAAGRTIMTTEPKFIPEEAVEITLGDNANLRVRMVDCVGYIVPSSLGYIENDNPRMVVTPWFDKEIPFNMAAEIGTQKVSTEHSTIGIVVTTDGTISEIPREEYAEAEERVIAELNTIQKPYVIVLNCMYPESETSQALREQLEQKYGVPVVLVNCLEMSQEDIKNILEKVIFEFPVNEIAFQFPKWINRLSKGNWLKSAIYQAAMDSLEGVQKIRHVKKMADRMLDCEQIMDSSINSMDLGTGSAIIDVEIGKDLFYQILEEETGIQISGESELLPTLIDLAKMQKEYGKIKSALDEVNATGYGIVMPVQEELKLEAPEIVRQGGKYGVRLRASAPSIHIECIKQICKISA